MPGVPRLPFRRRLTGISPRRGVRRTCGAGGIACDIMFVTVPCRWLFVDGVERDGALDDLVTPTEVAAIEVYDRSSLVPTEFYGRLTRTAVTGELALSQTECGAIAVWTRILARLR